MNTQTDQQLLQDYAGNRSESAFAELVRRHIDLVYSAVLRMVCDPHQAKDVTQGVFLALAQNARQLTEHPVVCGWLHRTAQNLAANSVRATVRRQVHEQKAAAVNDLLTSESDAPWKEIAPYLDAGLSELTESDRDALLLRYFERKSAQEMAAILNISAEAAQKRVSRAVERLREFFARRGVAIGAGGFVVAVSANAVHAAPVGLALTVSAAALTGASVTTTATVTIIKTLTMTTLQKVLITASIAAAVGTGIYEVHRASQLRAENQTLRNQQAPLIGQIQQLQRERDQRATELAALRQVNERLSYDNAELLKLRGQVTALRNQTDESQRQVSALRDSQKKAANNSQDAPPVSFAKDSWAFTGYATPEATLQSAMWAQSKRDVDTFLASLGPEAQAEVQSAMQRKPDSITSMMSAIDKVKNYTILKSVLLAEDQVLLRVRTDMEDGTSKITITTLKQVNGEWKVQSGRAE